MTKIEVRLASLVRGMVTREEYEEDTTDAFYNGMLWGVILTFLIKWMLS